MGPLRAGCPLRMSAAMLMTKRPREEAGEVAMMVTGCSPHRWKFTESPSPASKRTRAHAEAVAAASTSSSAFMVTDGGTRIAPWPTVGSLMPACWVGQAPAPADASRQPPHRQGPPAGPCFLFLCSFACCLRSTALIPACPSCPPCACRRRTQLCGRRSERHV